jgi:hypothetical protein
VLPTTDATSNEVTVTIPGGGGGSGARVKLVAKTACSFSPSSQLVIPISGYTGTYNKVTIRFIGLVVGGVAADDMYATISGDGGTTFDGGGVDYTGRFNNAEVATAFTDSKIKICTQMSISASEAASGDFTIIDGGNASHDPIFRWEMAIFDGSHVPRPITGAGARTSPKAVTHVRFSTNGGTTSGFYEIWGE